MIQHDSERGGIWWCNVHQREATHINVNGIHCCDQALEGILIPCNVVFAPMQIIDDKNMKGEERNAN